MLYNYITQEKKQSADAEDTTDTPQNLWMRSLNAEEMFEASFLPIARDGCNHLEIHLKLQECYACLYKAAPKEMKPVIKEISADSMAYVEKCHMIEKERLRLEKNII